jgi:hypothetical protein
MAQIMKRTHAAPMSVLLLIDRASGNDIMAISLEQNQKQDDQQNQRANTDDHSYLPRQSRHHALPASAASGMSASNPITTRTTAIKSR